MSWNKDTDHLNCYNRINVPSDGILTITATKPLDSYGKNGALEFYLYEYDGKIVWGNETYRAKSDASSSYTLNVGVARGSYYLSIKPGFTVREGTIDTVYSLSFTATPYCEHEPNETAATATALTFDQTYTGWLGYDGASGAKNCDFYRFTTIANHYYTLSFDDPDGLLSSTAMVQLINSAGTVNSIGNKLKSGSIYFYAAVDGVYTIKIYNYNGVPLRYGIQVKAETGNDNFTVSYNANGGTGAPANQVKRPGVSLRLSTETPVRDGYSFLGWGSSSALLKADYAPGATYSANANLTLYAIWQEITPGNSGWVGATLGTTMANAVNVSFGTSYRKTWSKDTDHLNCYNKITVPQDGQLVITASKPSDSDEYGSLSVYLYDSTGATVWGNETYSAKADGRDSYRMYVGVRKGEYYLTLKPGFSVISGNITTDYCVHFYANAYTEHEPNEATAAATLMEKNHFYAGYLGNDGASNTEERDCFSFTATAGVEYTIKSDNFDRLASTTVMVYLIDPTGSSTSIDSALLSNVDGNGNTYYRFTAKYTGVYHLIVYNYSGRQRPYAIGVFTSGSEQRYYAVTYDANGGTGAPARQMKQQGTALALSDIIPERIGYQFLGWAKSASASTPAFFPGNEYAQDLDLTLFAVWQQIPTGPSVTLSAYSGVKMNSPVDVVLGTSYTRPWNKDTDHLNCYNRIVLPEDGILRINATKPYDSDEYGSMDFYLYNAAGDLLWGNGTSNAKSDGRDSYVLSVGLGKGTYYLTIKPGFTVISGNITTTYRLTLDPTPYCEHEPNETASSATVLELNHYYSAFLGGDGARNCEEADYYKFTTEEGRTYTIRSGSYSSLSSTTAIFTLYNPENKSQSIYTSLTHNLDANGSSFYTFRANYTGTYVLRIYNYGSRQVGYTIGVFTEDDGSERPFTVTYNANGGTGAPKAQLKASDSVLILSDAIPSRLGFRFLGWGSSSASAQPLYQPGDEYTADADAVLYAVWAQTGLSGSSDLGTTLYSTASSAVNASFGCTYTRGWTRSTYTAETYHKLVVPADGIISIVAEKPSDAEEYGSLVFTLYDTSYGKVWANATDKAKDDPKDSYRLSVGVPAGTYYLAIKPGFTVISGTITSTYSFTFKSTDYAEMEPNETKDTATPMALNHFYQGYFGNDGATGTAKEDYFSFPMVEGQTYYFRAENIGALASTTTIMTLYDPSGRTSSLMNDLANKTDRSGISYSVYTARGTGTAYLRLYNYSASQAGYSIGVFTQADPEPVQYTITYDANGGEGGIARQTRFENTSVILSANVPRRGMYRFLGWALDPASLHVVYRPGDVYSANENITLYAVWVDFSNLPCFSVPDGVAEIEAEAFCGLPVMYVYIPDSCQQIGARAFADCSQLVVVSLPSTTAVAPDAFEDCECEFLYRVP